MIQNGDSRNFLESGFNFMKQTVAIFSGLFFLSVLLAGVYLYVNQKPRPIRTASGVRESATTTVSVIPDPKTPKTFTNTKFQYSFEYPKKYYVVSEDNEPEEVSSAIFFPDGFFGISVLDETQKTLTEYVEEKKEEYLKRKEEGFSFRSGVHDISIEEQSVAGFPAVAFVVQEWPKIWYTTEDLDDEIYTTIYVYFERDGFLYEVFFKPGEQESKRTFESLKFF